MRPDRDRGVAEFDVKSSTLSSEEFESPSLDDDDDDDEDEELELDLDRRRRLGDLDLEQFTRH